MAEQARILVVDDEPAVQNALSRALDARALRGRPGGGRARGAGAPGRGAVRGRDPRHLDAPRGRPGGLPAPARRGRPDAGADAHGAANRSTTASPAWTRAPTTTSSSRSRCASCSPACARCCAAPGEEDEQEHALAFEDLRLDRLAHEAWRGERLLQLTRTEFLLLEMFLRHPRQVLTRSAIFEHVWGYDFGATSNSLGVYMGYLRRKTEVGDEPRLLHTVRGVGYVLRGAAMSFRRRITLVSAAAVAIAVVLASLLTYLLTSHQLHSQVDSQLRNRARQPEVRRAQPRGAPRPATAWLDLIKRQDPDQAPRPGSAGSQGGASPSSSLLQNLPPRPNQVRGYQQLVDAQRPRSVSLGERDAAGRSPHSQAGRRHGRTLLPRRPRERHPSAHPRRAHRAGARRPGRPAAHRSRQPAQPPAPDPGRCSTSAASRSRRCSDGSSPAPPCCR